MNHCNEQYLSSYFFPLPPFFFPPPLFVSLLSLLCAEIIFRHDKLMSLGIKSWRLSLINQTLLAEGIVPHTDFASTKFLISALYLSLKSIFGIEKHFWETLSAEIEFFMSGREIGKTFSWSFVFVSPELFAALSQLLFCVTCSTYWRMDLLSHRGWMSALLVYLPPWCTRHLCSDSSDRETFISANPLPSMCGQFRASTLCKSICTLTITSNS